MENGTKGVASASARPSAAHHDIWSGFYRKTLPERRRQIRLVYPDLFPRKRPEDGSTSGLEDIDAATEDSSVFHGDEDEFPIDGLDPEIANNMIENAYGCMGLPLGLALNFTINGRSLAIPMAVEEPSVIAAVSGAAKTMSTFGTPRGFTATGPDRNVIFAQIQLHDIPDSQMERAIAKLNAERTNIIALANQYCQSMVNRGGGVVGMEVRRVPRTTPSPKGSEFSKEWLVVQLSIDVCDAMGANCASTVAEGTSPLLQEMLRCRIGLRIVSNLCTDRLSRARFAIPVAQLRYKSFEGAQVAERIIEANSWANDDIYRATTHNKGIMNGIDSVCIALGQDWRAIEAASHAYACRSGRYQALTKYWIEKNEAGEDVFMGELELPLAVGTKGGVLKTHPTYGYNLHIAGNPDAKQLSRILVCVGLAQNFAALRALTTEGIQRGHLSLHSRNIAIAAGAPPHAVAEVTAYMIETNRMTVDAAQQYLRAHEILGIVRQRSSPVDGPSTALPPSMLYYEDEVTGNENPLSGVETRVTFNIAFDTWTSSPNYLEYMANTERTSLASVLFGQRTYAWLSELMKLVTKLQLPGDYTRHNRVDIRRLKLISIVINVLARRLMAAVPAETFAFVDTHLFASSKPRLRERPKGDSMSRPRALSQPRVARAASIADISVRLAAMHDLVPPSVDSYVTEVRAQRRGSAKHPAQDYHVDWLFPPDLSASPAEAFPAEGLSEEKKQMIQVGFPLLLAMLQVFQLIVTERVGQPELVSQILAEQRRVLSAIVCAPLAHDCSSAADYEEFFAVHRKRFQMTLFLLLDATALDEATTDEATWDYCRKLGESVGDLVTRAHDAARLERDRGVASGGFALDGSLSGGRAVNSFVLWMAARGNDPQSIFTPDGKIAPDAQNTLAEFLADGPAVDMLSSDARKAYFKAKSAVAEHYSLL